MYHTVLQMVILKSSQVEGMGVDADMCLIDQKLIDEVITISDQEAYNTMHDLGKSDGIFIGPSSVLSYVLCSNILIHIPSILVISLWVSVQILVKLIFLLNSII